MITKETIQYDFCEISSINILIRPWARSIKIEPVEEKKKSV